MRKRVQIALAVLLLVIAGVIAWQVLRPRAPDPIYRGQRLSVWVNRSLGSDPANFRETVNFLMYHGPSADADAQALWRLHGDQIISRWIRALKTKDSFFWKPYMLTRQKAPHLLSQLLPQWTEPQKVREAALWWLNESHWWLKERHPDRATPALCEVAMSDPNRMNRRGAINALRNMGAYSEQVFQIMRAVLLSDPDPANRVDAAYWFKDTRAAPETAIPVLLGYLQDTNVELRRAACFALGAYGAQAMSATEPLRKLAASRNTYPELYVSWGADWAIKAIEADAAAKTEVK